MKNENSHKTSSAKDKIPPVVIVGIIAFLCCLFSFLTVVLLTPKSIAGRYLLPQEVLSDAERTYSEEFKSYLENNFSFEELGNIQTREQLAFLYQEFLNTNELTPTVDLPDNGETISVPFETTKTYFVKNGNYQFSILNTLRVSSVSIVPRGMGCTVVQFKNGVMLAIITDKTDDSGKNCYPTGSTFPCPGNSSTTTPLSKTINFGNAQTELNETRLDCANGESFLDPTKPWDFNVTSNSEGSLMGYGIVLTGNSTYADYQDVRSDIITLLSSISFSNFNFDEEL